MNREHIFGDISGEKGRVQVTLKIRNLIRQTLFSFVFSLLILGGVFAAQRAEAWGSPTGVQEDTLAKEVSNLKTLEEVLKAKDETYKAIGFYQSSLRQLGHRMSDEGSIIEWRNSMDSLEARIQELNRKYQLLIAREKALTPKE